MIKTYHEWRQEGRRVPSLPQELSFPDRLAFCIQPIEESQFGKRKKRRNNDWESHPKSPQGVHESRHVVRNSSVAWKACSWFKLYTHIHNVHNYIMTHIHIYTHTHIRNVHNYIMTYCNMFDVKYSISILNIIRSTSNLTYFHGKTPSSSLWNGNNA